MTIFQKPLLENILSKIIFLIFLFPSFVFSQDLNISYNDTANFYFEKEEYEIALNSYNSIKYTKPVTLEDSLQILQLNNKIFYCLYQINNDILEYESTIKKIDSVLEIYEENKFYQKERKSILETYSKIQYELGYEKVNLIMSMSNVVDCSLYDDVLNHFELSDSLNDVYLAIIESSRCYSLFENKNNKSINLLTNSINRIDNEEFYLKHYYKWNMNLNLAIAYYNIEDYKKSIKIHKELFSYLDLYFNHEEWLDPKSHFFILNCINYANSLSALGNHNESILFNKLIFKTISQIEKDSIEGYKDFYFEYNNMVNRNLAISYLKLDSIEKAKQIMLELSAIEQDSTNLAILFSDLSNIFSRQNKFLESNFYLIKSLNLFGNSKHYLKSKTLKFIFQNYLLIGDYESAKYYLEKLIERELKIMKENEFFLPPEANLIQQRDLLNYIFKLYNLNIKTNSNFNHKYWYFLKNRDLAQNIILNNYINEKLDTINFKKHKTLLNYKKKLFTLQQKDFLNGNDMNNYDFLKTKIEFLQNQILESTKINLSNESYSFIDKEINSNDFLVDIIKIPLMNNNELSRSQFRYYAFLKEKNKTIEQIFLGDSELIDIYFNKYKRYILDKNSDLNINKECYNVLFKKIEEKATKNKRIVFFPDGVYNFINPISFFSSSHNKFLLDFRQFKFINTYSQIKEDVYFLDDESIKSITIFSNPTFNLSPKTNQTDLGVYESIPVLNGTQKEKEVIKQLFLRNGHEVIDYNNSEASEINFKKIDLNNILHIATHGYYFNEFDHNKIFKNKSNLIVNPYLLSGILLSGAENTLNGNNSLREDGWLTGLELQSIDFSNTNLIILSACETLVGKTEDGRGVFGLSQAIKKSGGKNIISSLWKVDDLATQQFMYDFYDSLLKNKNVSNSLNISISKNREKYSHPFYWAPFVLIQ